MLKAQLKSELIKSSTSVVWWGVGVATVLISIVVCSFFTFAGLNVSSSPIDANDPRLVDTLLTLGFSLSYMLLLILGVLSFNLEFQNKTILYSLVGNPRRSVLYSVKLASAALSNAFFAALLCVSSLGIVSIISYTSERDVKFFPYQIMLTLVSLVVVSSLVGVIGASIGAMTDKLINVVVFIILWIQVIEPVVQIAAPQGVRKFLPSSLIDASLGGGFLGKIFGISPLSQMTALGVMALAAISIALVGWGQFRKKEF
ncbi:hypothetical protein [Dermatophilus congolensis]|uniref:hypothetical protein n=1 Tax=Dermatophilus congolensis TaxID=1863 RepID=UPI001AAEEEF8|nr:hypothetical protein [Dermatophilus congolensis]MBO3142398.1 hypothetical protein [Dermatophilus congolensis]MBO3151389.1 hypothetical protein [Dermatophilus congolensis]MBO3161609.1 hypothetical protein [Dermatophilus congolensis]MBO3162674.1 hypothetical protein [Dermatophilus congolensis]MBO3176228.1 hypothetical protein [Dermatophilus congolensis]